MKLVYFNGRGMAETSRLLFAAGGVEYEDFRYPLEIIDMKSSSNCSSLSDADLIEIEIEQSSPEVDI